MKKTDPTARLKAQAAKRRKRARDLAKVEKMRKDTNDHFAHMKAHAVALPLGLPSLPHGLGSNEFFQQGINRYRPLLLFRVRTAGSQVDAYVSATTIDAAMAWIRVTPNLRFLNDREIIGITQVSDRVMSTHE